MNFVSTKREPLILQNPLNPRANERGTPWPQARKETSWDRIVAALKDPDLAVVAMLCAIGLLATAGLLVAFPNFGEAMESVQQFF